MNWHACYATLAAGALATLIGSGTTPAREGKKAPRPGGPPHHLVTVRYGNTPVTDRKARKVVRVIDQEGRGVKDARIVLPAVRSCWWWFSRKEAGRKTEG